MISTSLLLHVILDPQTSRFVHSKIVKEPESPISYLEIFKAHIEKSSYLSHPVKIRSHISKPLRRSNHKIFVQIQKLDKKVCSCYSSKYVICIRMFAQVIDT